MSTHRKVVKARMEENALAVRGGTKVRERPFPPWPVFEEDEIETVLKVLKSGNVNYWTGDEGRLFEQEFADFMGVKFGIAVANGTVALELALYALGIGPGDQVIVPARTFIASASCVVARGATPIIADIDPQSQNLTADSIRAVLTKRTRAIIVVHLAGWPCDMDPIMELAAAHKLVVIEDCAQAHGASYKGRPVGSIGHAAAFSFCQDKIMTTGGEGGIFLTSDARVWEKAWAYKDHGKSYQAVYHQEHAPGFRWLHESFGTNWRMTEMQAAIGRLQLHKLPRWMKARRANARILMVGLRNTPGLRLPEPPAGFDHAYYRYCGFFDLAMLHPSWDQTGLIEAINAEGVPCFAGSCAEIYREEAFTRTGLGPSQPLPVAQRLGKTSLAFLVHPTADDQDMLEVCRVVEKVMRVAAKEPGTLP